MGEKMDWNVDTARIAHVSVLQQQCSGLKMLHLHRRPLPQFSPHHILRSHWLLLVSGVADSFLILSMPNIWGTLGTHRRASSHVSLKSLHITLPLIKTNRNLKIRAKEVQCELGILHSPNKTAPSLFWIYISSLVCALRLIHIALDLPS